MAFQKKKREEKCIQLQKEKERQYYEVNEGPQYRCIAFVTCVFGVIFYIFLGCYVVYDRFLNPSVAV